MASCFQYMPQAEAVAATEAATVAKAAKFNRLIRARRFLAKCVGGRSQAVDKSQLLWPRDRQEGGRGKQLAWGRAVAVAEAVARWAK